LLLLAMRRRRGCPRNRRSRCSGAAWWTPGGAYIEHARVAEVTGELLPAQPGLLPGLVVVVVDVVVAPRRLTMSARHYHYYYYFRVSTNDGCKTRSFIGTTTTGSSLVHCKLVQGVDDRKRDCVQATSLVVARCSLVSCSEGAPKAHAPKTVSGRVSPVRHAESATSPTLATTSERHIHGSEHREASRLPIFAFRIEEA